jgi:hypothetical protein
VIGVSMSANTMFPSIMMVLRYTGLDWSTIRVVVAGMYTVSPGLGGASPPQVKILLQYRP